MRITSVVEIDAPEFAAKAQRKWLSRLDVTAPFIKPRSLWEHRYIESFFEKLRDELLNGEGLDTPSLKRRALVETTFFNELTSSLI